MNRLALFYNFLCESSIFFHVILSETQISIPAFWLPFVLLQRLVIVLNSIPLFIKFFTVSCFWRLKSTTFVASVLRARVFFNNWLFLLGKFMLIRNIASKAFFAFFSPLLINWTAHRVCKYTESVLFYFARIVAYLSHFWSWQMVYPKAEK